MSSRDDRRDDELEARLSELEDMLTELRRDLRETERDRRGPPRPPRLSELVRFTEQYTIPTLIALLETTIRSLELLRGTLRLADPGRELADSAERTGDRLGDVRDGASAGLARSLSELRTALSETDLPEEAASRSIIADARDLTAEIESRIEEGRREADERRRRGRIDNGRETDDRRTEDRHADKRGSRASDDGTSGIQIDVTEPGDGPDSTEDRKVSDGEEDESEPTPEVDVDSELESIKRQLDGDTDAGNDPDETVDRDPDETQEQEHDEETDRSANEDETESGDDADETKPS